MLAGSGNDASEPDVTYLVADHVHASHEVGSCASSRVPKRSIAVHVQQAAVRARPLKPATIEYYSIGTLVRHPEDRKSVV